MRRTAVALTVLALVAGSATTPAFAQRPKVMEIQAGPDLGHVPAKGAHGGGGGAKAKPTSSVNMSWHSGSILTSSVTEPIFWGTGWGSSSFAGDKVSGLVTWYKGFGGSHYALASTEYTEPTAPSVPAASTTATT